MANDLILFAADGLLKTLQQPLGLLPRYLAELGQLVQQKAGHHTGDAQRRKTTDQPSVLRWIGNIVLRGDFGSFEKMLGWTIDPTDQIIM